MRENYIKQIENITENLDEDHKKFLFLQNLNNLINKLDDWQFLEEKDAFDQLIAALKVVSKHYNRKNRTVYITHFNGIKKTVREKYGFRKKGEMFGFYFGTVYPICVAFGILFKNIGLAASLGIVFTSAIAGMKEKEAEKKGLLY